MSECFLLILICPVISHRVTGAAVQVACEMRSGRRHSRAVTSDLSFSRLELLESLWEDGAPQYSEVEHLFVCLRVPEAHRVAVFTLYTFVIVFSL